MFWFEFMICFMFLITCSFKPEIGNNKFRNIHNQDSLDIWLNIANNSNFTKSHRSKFLIRSEECISQLENTPAKLKSLLTLADSYFNLGEYENFKNINKQILKIALRQNDSNAIAEYHWNKGTILSKEELLDSAYFHYNKSSNIYHEVGNVYYEAKMKFNMSFVHFRMKNYSKCENLVIDAITIFKTLKKNLNLYLCHNRLLLLHKELGNYDEAYEHFEKANYYLSRTDGKNDYYEQTLNNLSLVYQKQGNYDLAIKTLDKALKNSDLKSKNKTIYTKIVDNKVYSRFLRGDSLNVLDEFRYALALRKEMGNMAGIAISRMHFSEYYLRYKDSVRAYQEALQAYKITDKYKFNRDILVSLTLLAKSDPRNAAAYMDRYLSLNDSLISEERLVRDKFARIQFETDGYIAANKELEKKTVWITLISLMSLTTLSLLFLMYRQRSRNKTLLLEKQQQQANEEIYNLMLKQQNKAEEGRILERVRISEELHDGALARLFSVRIGMGFLEVKEDKTNTQQFDMFMNELQEVEREIRMISHELKNDELSSKTDFSLLLQDLLSEQSNLGSFDGYFEQNPSISWDKVDEKLKINLFRIAQEALHNIIKYAQCKEVTIALDKKEGYVQMSIVDDGKGFDQSKKPKGIGLKNMKSRAENMGAEVTISSSLGKGTKIQITIPTKTIYYDPQE